MKLFELIIVAGVVAILAGAVSMPLIVGIDLWRVAEVSEVKLPEFHVAMDRITREMTFMEKDSMFMDTSDREISFTSGLVGGGGGGGATALSIEWKLAERTLYINDEPLYGPDSVSEPEAWGAYAFRVRPYNFNNVEHTSFPLNPSSFPPNDIWYFRIDITIGDGTTFHSYTRYVHPRNYLWSERAYNEITA